MLKPLVIIGAGGHASVLVDILLSQGRQILAFVSPKSRFMRRVFSGIPQIFSDHDIDRFGVDEVMLVNGLGMLPGSKIREEIHQHYCSLGYEFETVIAVSAEVSEFAVLGQGVQVLSKAVIQAGAYVGDQTIINSGALLEHDCRLGALNHVASQATLCGQVRTEDNVFVGAGATIIQNICLGRQSVVGAGAVLVNNLEEGATHYASRGTTKVAKLSS